MGFTRIVGGVGVGRLPDAMGSGEYVGYEPNLPPGVMDELISGRDDGDTQHVGGDTEGCLGCSARVLLVIVAIVAVLTILVYAANSCSTL